MAGGEGRRLRPLTESKPKPLVPVGGIPVIKRLLDLLEYEGVDEAVVTTGYLAEEIESYCSKLDTGIKLGFSREDEPLGTAGSVKEAAKHFKAPLSEPFIVISGDSVCEMGIKEAMSFHNKAEADATILLTETDNPLEYGVVICDENGRITDFVEKPSLSHAYAVTVNTGIYIINPRLLDRIPDGISYDFGSQLFPELLRRGFRLFGRKDDGYWCDIGDLSSYYEANMRFSGGESVIGNNCILQPSAAVDGCVLMDNVTVGDGCSITRAVICEGCVIGDGASIGPECVIGSDCVIGSGAVLEGGVVIRSGSRIPDGLIMQRSSVLGSVRQASDLLFDGGIRFEIARMGSSFLFRLGRAISDAMKSFDLHSASIMHSEGTVCNQLLRGLRSGEIECTQLGVGFEAAAASSPRLVGVDLSLFACQKDGFFSVFLFDKDGLYPVRSFERKLIISLTKNDEQSTDRLEPAGYPSSVGEVKEIGFLESVYLPELIGRSEKLSDAPVVAVKRDNLPSLYLTRALIARGVSIGTGINEGGVKMTFSLSSDGRDVLVCISDGESGQPEEYICIDFPHVIALLCRDLCDRGKKFSLPVTVPLVLRSRLSAISGKEIPTYTSCPCDEKEKQARALASKHPELTDGLFAAVELISLICRKASEGVSVSKLFYDLPSFFVSQEEVIADMKTSISAVSKLGKPSGDGVAIRFEGGFVRAVPSGKGIRLTAEAASGEYASEILDMSKKRLKELLDKS